MAAPPTLDALRQGLAGLSIPGSVDWQVASADPLFCPALDIISPLTRGFGATGPRLALNLVDGRTQLRDSDHIRPRLVMGDFKGFLRVDYVAHDGNVLHLYPQVADPKQGMVADAPRQFAPGEAVSLGEVSPGHLAWEVGEPYGADMIIAIQSAQPLFNKSRPGNVEAVADYLRDLRAVVEDARRRGARLMGNVLMVDTLPK